ncbi:MAG: hypothetical protein IKW21_03690 [Lachnospiraceae bacterium]|nr:hypothetical protein [Lachnospiraceae bacterium]
MVRIDCSLTLNYVKELKRMCETHEFCSDDCPMYEYQTGCSDVINIEQKHIDIVQKWLDEHPHETMAEHFFKMFPNAPKSKNNNPRICTEHLGWGSRPDCDLGCSVCWNRPYIEGGAE